MLLGKFYLTRERIDDAMTICEQIDSLLHDTNGIDMLFRDANLMGKANTLSLIFYAYYKAGRYEDAFRTATEFHDCISSYIQQNFDLMTQNEREGFSANNTTGSLPLYYLLPHMPERLAGPAYNAALSDKGLLLRSSNRIQKAIAASGNDTLIHAVDSLRLLQAQLLSIQSTDMNAQSQFATLREKVDRLERFISRKALAYKQEVDVVPSWQQVREQLKKDEAAVEYIMTDSTLMALVLTPKCEQPEVIPLMGSNDAMTLSEMTRGKTPTLMAKSLYGAGHIYFYEKLWKPLETHFKGATKIFFSPTGFLNSLAFAAFTLPDNSYLIDHYELHQLTTTARIAYRNTRKKTKRHAMTANIYGALYYNEEQREYYEPRLESLRQSFQTGNHLAQNVNQRGAAEEFPFLESSLYEADVVETILKQEKVKTSKLTGSIPTEQALRQMDGHSPDILLISTHGFFYNDISSALQVPYFQKRQNMLNAMTSTGLILADGERTWQGEQQDEAINDATDNILSSNEVATMNLTGTQLAILSACETGLGSTNTMEGVYGLQRGFKQAGVRSLCASLWSVNDLTTAELIQSFFHNWLSGAPGMTMQLAMIEAMREQRARTPEPYFWAPFVLYDADF